MARDAVSLRLAFYLLQPYLPGELRFCDIRLPETRELRARLARAMESQDFVTTTTGSKGACWSDRSV